MKTPIITLSTCALLVLCSCSNSSTGQPTIAPTTFDLPTSWFRAGSDPKSYDMGVDKTAGKDGKHAATIKSIEKKINGFGTLMQSVPSASMRECENSRPGGARTGVFN